MKQVTNTIEHNSDINLVKVDDGLYALAFGLMKLTPAEHIITSALNDGTISSDTTIVETTSGTLGLGLALVCRHYGLRLILVSDDAIRGPLLGRIQDLGAQVEIVEPKPGEGIQKTRLDRLHALLDEGSAFCPHQYDNAKNAESYHKIGEEIAQRLPSVGTIVGPVGSGGSLCGLTTALRSHGQKQDAVRAVAVDTPGSTLFGLPDAPRELRGLGNSLHPKNLKTTMIDQVYWVTYRDAVAATRALHARAGIYAGPTSGAAYLAAIDDMRERQKLNGPVIFVCPDRGDRYPEVYSGDDELIKMLAEVPWATDGEVHSTCKHNWARKELHIDA
ncbi:MULTISPECIES: pyridoxal-phosphate dependent enzyme [Auritidibacter]|uniref:pyridoxal-phosphate dependent enzyme n=1 Tax=Auritidibacter TaxID=1160973 RepID=UPI000D727817|nr:MULTISPECIES: pyridoxal-phosphate dependent enzyme [Auritidibacter]PXA75262.1 hypothetical protein DCC24_11670 [Auritidibacter sp. NML100628]WHS27411.1 pyridoxal-phosphate dependent enzyme [Auritidibacter ignavus]